MAGKTCAACDCRLDENAIKVKIGTRVVEVCCEECAQTGYRGRAGIYELLPVTDTVKGLILERASSGLVKDAAVKQGMRTLRDDGWRTVRTGVTTVAEVVRVTQEEM